MSLASGLWPPLKAGLQWRRVGLKADVGFAMAKWKGLIQLGYRPILVVAPVAAVFWVYRM